MSSDIILIEQQLNATVEIVWQALTNATQMKHWYFATENFIAEPGFSFVMYGEKEGNFFPIHGCIIEVIKNKLLSYSWSYQSSTTTTVVSFELIKRGNQSSITFTHKGLKDIPAALTNLSAANQIVGWKNIIKKSLKNYVEKRASANL